MKNKIVFVTTYNYKKAGLICMTILSINITISLRAHARGVFDKKNPKTLEVSDSSNEVGSEKKVDYIEKIYFSGQNKSGLTGLILATIQDLEGKKSTLSVAKQYTFLSSIQPSAEDAPEACAVLELLASGIYAIDANEAIQQGIVKPTKTAPKSTIDALASVDNLSKNANDIAVSNYYLNNGSASSVNTLGTASKATQAGNMAKGAISMGQTLKDVSTTIFKKKDSPCRSVPTKKIEIGVHGVQPINNTIVAAAKTDTKVDPKNDGKKIIFKNITFQKIHTIMSSIERIAGVSGVGSNGFANGVATISVNCTMRMDDLITKIMDANKTINLDVEVETEQEATLIVRQ